MQYRPTYPGSARHEGSEIRTAALKAEARITDTQEKQNCRGRTIVNREKIAAKREVPEAGVASGPF